MKGRANSGSIDLGLTEQALSCVNAVRYSWRGLGIVGLSWSQTGSALTGRILFQVGWFKK